jgi:hypothetical protein
MKRKKKQWLPKGWTEEDVRAIIDHYDNQTDEERWAEIEALRNAENITMVAVPTDRVPEVLDLLERKKKPAKKKKSA